MNYQIDFNVSYSIPTNYFDKIEKKYFINLSYIKYIMNDLLYLIIIICLTFFIIFYGGHNNQDKIEYDSDYFNNLNSIIKFEKKINSFYLNDNNIFINTNFINIDKYFNTTNILLPNYVNCFLIKIDSHCIFNIENIIEKSKCKTHIMVIFNHNLKYNLELVIDDLDNSNNNDGYCNFYNLKKNISTTGIYHIYNNSNENVVITCFILKKPFWHK